MNKKEIFLNKKMNEENITTQLEEIISSDDKIHLEKISMNHLLEISKWAKFIAIVGFVFIVVIVIIGFSMGTIISYLSDEVLPFPMFIFGFIYLLLGAIYFYPLFALFKFALNAKTAVNQLNSNKLTIALKHLRGVFTFLGIITLLGLIIFIFEIVAILIFIPLISH